MFSYEWQSTNTLYLFLTTEFYIIEVGDGTMSKTGCDVYHALIKTHTCSLVILIFEIESPSCVDPEGGGGGGGQGVRSSSEKSQKCNSGPDPLKNHKATGIICPLLVLFGSSFPSSPKKHTHKKTSELDPLWQNFLDQRIFLCLSMRVRCMFKSLDFKLMVSS